MKRKLISFIIVLCFIFNPTAIFSSENNRNIIYYESESNNSIATADVIKQSSVCYGYINYSNDIDYYSLQYQNPGNVTITLVGYDSTLDYDLQIIYPDGHVTTLNSSSSVESMSLSVSQGQRYYFKVYIAGSGYELNVGYCLKCDIESSNFAYYSQKNHQNGTGYNITNLSDSYFKINGEMQYTTSWALDIDRYGCYACSFAMVLKNLNATYTHSYNDVRYINGVSSTQTLADPVTVCFANKDFPTFGTSTINSNTVYEFNCDEPVVFSKSNIEDGFNVTIHGYPLNNNSDINARNIAYLLSDHPEGIIVVFYDSTLRSHAVVFRSTTLEIPPNYSFNINESSKQYLGFDEDEFIDIIESKNHTIQMNSRYNYNLYFNINDPVDNDYNGNNVLLSDSYTGTHYSFSDAVMVYVLD